MLIAGPAIRATALALSTALLLSMAPVARAAEAVDTTAPSADAAGPPPGVCFAVASPLLDADGWTRVTDAVAEAARERRDFFPDGLTVTVHDAAVSEALSATTGGSLDIWGIDPSDVHRQLDRPIGPAAADCLRPGHVWTLVIRQGLLRAAAERLLAGARDPVDGAEPLVPVDARATIDVEFDPMTRRIRTILDWSKPVAFFDVGGQCWIDDVLDAAGGRVVVRSTAGRDVTLGGDAGCDLFMRFLESEGAGTRAVSMLPGVIGLDDGSTLRLVVESIEVDQATLVFSGSVE
jgi:hypothetical protein